MLVRNLCGRLVVMYVKPYMSAALRSSLYLAEGCETVELRALRSIALCEAVGLCALGEVGGCDDGASFGVVV